MQRNWIRRPISVAAKTPVTEDATSIAPETASELILIDWEKAMEIDVECPKTDSDYWDIFFEVVIF